jgi:hypothetical protein
LAQPPAKIWHWTVEIILETQNNYYVQKGFSYHIILFEWNNKMRIKKTRWTTTKTTVQQFSLITPLFSFFSLFSQTILLYLILDLENFIIRSLSQDLPTIQVVLSEIIKLFYWRLAKNSMNFDKHRYWLSYSIINKLDSSRR